MKILGIALLIAAVVAIFLQDILALWVCVLFGFFCLYTGTKKATPKPKSSPKLPQVNPPEPQITEPTAPIVRAEPAAYSEPITEPTRKVSWHLTFKVAGVTFDCAHGDNYYDRQEVLEESLETDKLTLEEYTFKGSPAFLIINDRLDADIGNVPAWAVERIKEKSYIYDFDCEFINIDLFDRNDAGDYGDPDYVYYCKVRLNGYKKR